MVTIMKFVQQHVCENMSTQLFVCKKANPLSENKSFVYMAHTSTQNDQPMVSDFKDKHQPLEYCLEQLKKCTFGLET